MSDSWVLANRSIKHIRRNLDQLLGVAIQPIMFMVLFVYIFGGAINTGDVSDVVPVHAALERAGVGRREGLGWPR